jgi:hypothetical protein
MHLKHSGHTKMQHRHSPRPRQVEIKHFAWKE